MLSVSGRARRQRARQARDCCAEQSDPAISAESQPVRLHGESRAVMIARQPYASAARHFDALSRIEPDVVGFAFDRDPDRARDGADRCGAGERQRLCEMGFIEFESAKFIHFDHLVVGWHQDKAVGLLLYIGYVGHIG